MRRAAKVDNGHAAMVAELRAMGWAVADLSGAGGGVPDLLVSVGQSLPFAPARKARGVLTAGEAYMVEVKSKGGELTPAQQEWIWQFRGPLIVAETAEDVVAGIAAIRAARKGR